MDYQMLSEAVKEAAERYGSTHIQIEGITIGSPIHGYVDFKWTNSRGRFNSSLGHFKADGVPILYEVVDGSNSQRPYIFCKYVASAVARLYKERHKCGVSDILNE
ncbi:MAG: hypothetical protein J6I76_03275 [Oribacterium sp.]|nr:hypothetical protein [Oribacterium sp.]